MPDNSNPQVVAFSNTEIRPMADKMYGAYYKAKSVVQNYNTDGIGALISAAGASNLIGDGSDVDGRTRISGDDIINFITALSAFIAYIENGAVSTANRIDVITKPHVNNF